MNYSPEKALVLQSGVSPCCCETKLAKWLRNLAMVLRADWEPPKISVRLGDNEPWPVE